MPPGVPHVHPWNTGSDQMVFRHTNDFGATTPEALTDVIGAFATMFGLAREGKVGKRGLPKNPLQLAATARTLTRHRSFDAAIPIPVQLAVSATLGRLAEALGYRGVYDRYFELTADARRRATISRCHKTLIDCDAVSSMEVPASARMVRNRTDRGRLRTRSEAAAHPRSAHRPFA